MKIIECPRDAMQGINTFIPTINKARYINQLLKVGFDTIDFGSFVSVKAIPQMSDTREVLELLELEDIKTKLLAIVANQRGAQEAVKYESIKYLGYPLSVSETFQIRNTNRSIAVALNDLQEINNLCLQYDKKLVVYLSMGFGNPYGDPYDVSLLGSYTEKLDKMGINIISLADTVGISNSDNIGEAFRLLVNQFKHIEFGVHLHSRPDSLEPKIQTAYEAGCRRFDGAIMGFGGCPMADDHLVGNVITEVMAEYFKTHQISTGLNEAALQKSVFMAQEIFSAAM